MAKSKEEQDEADAADAEAAAAVAAAVEAANAAEDGDGQVIQKKKSLRMCRKCYFQEDVFKHSKYTQCDSLKRRANSLGWAIICAGKKFCAYTGAFTPGSFGESKFAFVTVRESVRTRKHTWRSFGRK